VAADAFAARLAALQAAFRSQLPERLADMRRLAAGGPAEIAELRTIAHKLAGQGGTFGAPEVGDAAAAVEHAEPSMLAAAIDRLADAIDRLA